MTALVSREARRLRADLAAVTGAARIGRQAPGGVARTLDQKAGDMLAVPDMPTFAAIEALTGLGAFLPEGEHVVSEAQDLTRQYFGPGVIRHGREVRNLNAWQSVMPAMHVSLGRIGNIATLQAAIFKKAVKVVFVGDSITEGLSQIAYADSWAALLQGAIENIPGVAWSFENLSLAGRGIGELNSPDFVGDAVENPGATFNRVPGKDQAVPSAVLWPAGSTNGKSWREHVRDAAPDLLIIALGINDTSGDANAWQATARSLIDNYISTWAKVPSIAFVTPMLPTRRIPAWALLQENIQGNADAIRSLCEEKNLTCIDVNRLYRAYREGRDVARLRSRYQAGFADWNTGGAWAKLGTPPALAGNTLTWAASGISLRQLAEKDAHLSAIFTPNEAGTPFELWYRAKPGDLNKAYVAQVQGAVPQVVLFYNSVPVASAAIPAVVAGQPLRLEVEVTGARHIVRVNGVRRIDVFDYQRLYAGYCGINFNGAGTAGTFTARGGYARCVGMAELPEDVLLGKLDDYTVNPDSLGGNAINHPSQVGHFAAYFGACGPLVRTLEREAARLMTPMLTAAQDVTAGDLAIGDFIGVTIAGVGGGASMVNHNKHPTPSEQCADATCFHFMVVTGASALCKVVKDSVVTPGAVDYASCEIVFPYIGTWAVLAIGNVSKQGANLRHSIRAMAWKQNDA